jgi:CheY-like chemotaxis protein
MGTGQGGDNEGGPATGGDSPASGPVATVVAIDDDAMTLLMISRTLAVAGMVCHTATDGVEGLRLIRELKPDLVLLDIVLVGEDGFGICREIRRTWSPEELPVVMVTGLDDLGSIHSAYQAGANDFLAKPLHWKHLSFRILHVLQASQSLRELRESLGTLRSILAVHPDSIFMVDREEQVTLVHSGSQRGESGHRPALGTLARLLPEDLAAQVRERCQQALGTPSEVLSLDFTHPFENEPRFCEARFVASAQDRVLVMVRDITQRKLFEQQIRHMAYHDVLTGLWNRHAFNSTLERVFLAEIQRRPRGRSLAPEGGHPLPGPGQFQAGQRHPGPRPGGRPAEGGRRPGFRGAAPFGHARPG